MIWNKEEEFHDRSYVTRELIFSFARTFWVLIRKCRACAVKRALATAHFSIAYRVSRLLRAWRKQEERTGRSHEAETRVNRRRSNAEMRRETMGPIWPTPSTDSPTNLRARSNWKSHAASVRIGGARVPLLRYVSRQHGKYVGARVVSRQAPAATPLQWNEVFVWRCRSVFRALSRLISHLAGLRCGRMGQSDDAEDSMYGRHQDLCQKLNMDAAAASEAWKSYETIRQNYTLEVVFTLRLRGRPDGKYDIAPRGTPRTMARCDVIIVESPISAKQSGWRSGDFSSPCDGLFKARLTSRLAYLSRKSRENYSLMGFIFTISTCIFNCGDRCYSSTSKY